MTYIIIKVFSTIKKVKLIEKKKFIAAAFNPDYKVFIIYVIALNIIFNINNKLHPL